MKNKFVLRSIYLLIFVSALVSCNDNFKDVEVPEKDKYLVETEELTSYSKGNIDAFFLLANLIYPDEKNRLEKFQSHLKTGITVHKITYKTTFNGNEVQASGVVCLPDVGGTYPIFSYQNGTNTLHSKAPSVDYKNQLFRVLQFIGSTGFIVAIPDYLGFGESSDMFHPYLDKKSTVQSVMDMWRAIEEMVKKRENIAFNKNLYITGYSQGGWSTMALHEAIEKSTNKEFRLKANASAGGPYNLSLLNSSLLENTEYPTPHFLAYLFNSYNKVGLSTRIDAIFQQPYASLIPTLFDGAKTGSEIDNQLTPVIADLFTPEYLNGWSTDSKFAPIKEMLANNSIEAFTTTAPILLLHGTADKDVPSVMASNIYAGFKGLGVSSDLVKYTPLEGLSHRDAIVPASLTAISWIIEEKAKNP